MQAGKFDPHSGRIEICEEAIQSVSHVEDTLSHELIHAYDHCRIEWQEDSNLLCIGIVFVDLRHLACSEIRAANLSGDCKWSREFMRGNWQSFAAHHQVSHSRI